MKGFEPRSLNHRVILEPGLPPLVQVSGHGSWYTGLQLPELHALTQGLADRRRPEAMPGGLLEPGDVLVFLATDEGFPSEMQLLNLHFLLHSDAALASALLAAVLGFYPRLRQSYDFLPAEELPVRLPETVTEAVLRRLIRLDSLTIHAIPHASTPYLGAEFACAWDEEHGLGVLTLGSEALAVGTADVSQDGAAARAHRAATIPSI